MSERQQPFWFDYDDVYKLDKFEYYPRDNYGNGTVNNMTIWLSMDGANWKNYLGTSEEDGSNFADQIQTSRLNSYKDFKRRE